MVITIPRRKMLRPTMTTNLRGTTDLASNERTKQNDRRKRTNERANQLIPQLIPCSKIEAGCWENFITISAQRHDTVTGCNIPMQVTTDQRPPMRCDRPTTQLPHATKKGIQSFFDSSSSIINRRSIGIEYLVKSTVQVGRGFQRSDLE